MTRRRLRPVALAGALSIVVAAGCGATPSPTPVGPDGGTPSASASATSAATSAASASGSAAPSSGSVGVTCSDSSAAPTFSPRPIASDDPNAAVLDRIEASVQDIRGLTPEHPVPRNTLDQASVCAFLRRSLDASNPAAFVAATERLDTLLGLLQPGASLRKILLDLETNQVVGFYDENTKQMYVVSSTGAIGPAEQFVYAHEYDHALQDQAFDVKSVLGTAKDQSDRRLARLSLAEGDATLLMSLWAQKNLTAAQLVQVAGSANPASQAALNAAPPFLRDTLLWPYTAGLQLVLGAYTPSASYAGVNAIWKHPPDTTEQVLHADKFASREPAVPVEFPGDFAKRLGAGWKVAIEDTLGEVELNSVMRTGDPGVGVDPAAGWGGDRVALVQGPGGTAAAVLDTAWDTTAAATNAMNELQKLAAKLNADGKHAAALMPSSQRVVLISADSAATLAAVANVLGLAG